MFYVPLAVFAAIAVVTSTEGPKPPHFDSLLQMTQEALEDCFEDDANTAKIEVTEAGFEGLLLGLHDVPRNTKCLRYCIMRRNKLFNSESQLDADEMLDFFEKLYSSVTEKQKLKEVVLRCKDKASEEEDRCERAHVAGMCILDSAF